MQEGGCVLLLSFVCLAFERRRLLFDQSLQLLEVWQSVYEPEIDHIGGESGRRGNGEDASHRRLDLCKRIRLSRCLHCVLGNKSVGGN